MVGELVADLAIVAGFAAVAVGVFFVYWPAALIVGGVLLALLGFAWFVDVPGDEE